ncbi:DUF1573 domain-containing protein [Bacteroides ihuae]|uniref:DUF1573 domain-containing protein n=1 Tax=Bacteroides ihuae TaxID=1852362 RepID=UPI0008DA2194|nr:DUF1573 domain-containing protein [Bacteroides ihuae]
MKSFTVLFVLVAVLGSQLYSQTVSKVISFEERVFDFGQIKEKDGKVSHTFVFRNEGKMPIAINGVTSGCGCTTSSYSKEPLRTGSKGKVTITFNPLYRPGFFSKEIVVLSNDGKNFNRIWVKGRVVPYAHPVEEDYPYEFGDGLHLNLKVLVFGTLVSGKTNQIELRYANDTNKPMSLNFIVAGSDKNLKFSNPKKILPKQRGKMIFSYTMPKNIHGEKAINIYPVVNGKKLSNWLQAKIMGVY